MPMYDYGFAFSSAAVAEADAVMLENQFDVTLGWATDHVLAGLQVWKPANDVTTQVTNPNPPPPTVPQITHTYLTGYFVLVMINTPSPIPALANHPNLQFILNRTAREAGQPFVVKNNIGATLGQIGVAPVPQSSNPYPVGGFA